jgi:GGDEF domain-containing protein
MTGRHTARLPLATERQKARARLVLLAIIALVCPPLAGVRSPAVWIFYVAFAVLYSLWALRLTRKYSDDRRLGYLLCLTDAAILLPLMVWTSASTILALLLALCACGLVFTYWADRVRGKTADRSRRDIRAREQRAALNRHDGGTMETPLERALRVRLRVLDATETRFAVVLLRIMGFDEIDSAYGEEASHRLLSRVSRRGLHLLGPDAQHFILSGGRVAFVFATGTGGAQAGVSGGGAYNWIDPYDVESFAMTLGHRACEQLIEGHRVECVVGWASAPADGMSPEDLMYAAESGAQSAAAYRRVAGSRVPVPDKTRVAAG